MFDPDKIYRPTDPALLDLLSKSTWDHMRAAGEGPRYYKVGTRVFYKGADLDAWWETRAVEPTEKGQAVA